MKSEPRVNLCSLVDQLVCNISPSSQQKQIINDIDPSVHADTCSGIIRQVLHKLLDHASDYAESRNIRISAKTFHNVILVQVKYNDSRERHEIERGLEKIKGLLGRLGGCMYINDYKTNEPTISITFLNRRLSRVA